MKRLITLGCSLGPKQLWPTYTRRLLVSLNFDFTHVHIGAGARGNKVNLFLLNHINYYLSIKTFYNNFTKEGK